jgi:arginase family enzyme
LGNDSITGQKLLPISIDGKNHPRIITLGGDHTIVLPLLRSIHSTYGPISVIHFDSHLGDLFFEGFHRFCHFYCAYQILGSRPSLVALPLTKLLLTMEHISIGPVKKA